MKQFSIKECIIKEFRTLQNKYTTHILIKEQEIQEAIRQAILNEQARKVKAHRLATVEELT